MPGVMFFVLPDQIKKVYFFIYFIYNVQKGGLLNSKPEVVTGCAASG
jgi:hypothetical protein